MRAHQSSYTEHSIELPAVQAVAHALEHLSIEQALSMVNRAAARYVLQLAGPYTDAMRQDAAQKARQFWAGKKR